MYSHCAFLSPRTYHASPHIEVVLASLQSTQGRSRAASATLKPPKKGSALAYCGVMGRLGDLSTITKEHNVAVSTVCEMLHHLVVQTTAGTQKCLEFL